MVVGNIDPPPEAIFHSDRGSNYASAQFGHTLKSISLCRFCRAD